MIKTGTAISGFALILFFLARKAGIGTDTVVDLIGIAIGVVALSRREVRANLGSVINWFLKRSVSPAHILVVASIMAIAYAGWTTQVGACLWSGGDSTACGLTFPAEETVELPRVQVFVASSEGSNVRWPSALAPDAHVPPPPVTPVPQRDDSGDILVFDAGLTPATQSIQLGAPHSAGKSGAGALSKDERRASRYAGSGSGKAVSAP